MGAGYSEVDIYNAAFDLLEEESAVTVNDARAPVKWMKRNFPMERDALLRRVPWGFARARASITAETTIPAFEFSHQYVIPADALRVLPFTYVSRTGYTPYPHQIEGNLILTNLSSPAKIIYVKRVLSTGSFDSLFTVAIATRLALKAAHWMTGKQSFVAELKELYKMHIDEAIEIDAVENNYQIPYDDELLLSRI